MSRVTACTKGAGKRKLRRMFVTKDKVAEVCVKLTKGAKLVIYIHKRVLLGR
jgi:hypothetical protein